MTSPDASKEKIVAIVGPTASGKTGTAVAVAERVGGEIVSADSVAVYRRLNIGSAKPTELERGGITHHLIDVANPTERFDAMRYAREAGATIADIIARGRIPIVVGGTGLYLKALVYGLVPAPEADRDMRRSLRERVKTEGPEKLHRELAAVDPESAAKIEPRDGVRIVRALEIYSATGLPAEEIRRQHGFLEQRYNVLTFGLLMERDFLYRRINERVIQMMQGGIVDEVKNLLEEGCTPQDHALGAIGYREVCAHLRGAMDLNETVDLIQRNTRRLAKRQMTWFRKMPDIHWVHYPYPIDEMSEAIFRFYGEGT